MNDDEDRMRRGEALEQMLTEIFAGVFSRIDELPLSRKFAADAVWYQDGRQVIAECKTYRGVTFSGSVALPAMSVRGTTTTFPDLPAAYVTQTQRTLVITRHVFLIVLMWVIVIALPVLKQHLRVSPDTRQTMRVIQTIL